MNDYYNAPTIYDFTRARAAQPNTEANSTEAAFDLLPDPTDLDLMIRTVVVAGGTADALTITYADPILSYALGQWIMFKAALTNTGPATVDVDALGVKGIIRQSGTTLEAGDIQVDRIYALIYDGAQFQILSGIMDLTVGGISDYLTQINDAVAAAEAAAAVAVAAAATVEAFEYPGAGIPVSNGSGWDTSKTAPVGDLVGVTDTQTLTNKTMTDPAWIGCPKEDIYTITDGPAFEIDPSNGTIQSITLGSNRSPLATNFVAGEYILLRVDDGPGGTITWPSVVWISGIAPTLPTSGWAWIELWKVGSILYGALVGSTAT